MNMNIKKLEASLAHDHMRRGAFPPLTRARRRRARKIMFLARQYYMGKKDPNQRTRAIARAILAQADNRK